MPLSVCAGDFQAVSSPTVIIKEFPYFFYPVQHSPVLTGLLI
jgi:hypothetical protein